MGVYLNWKTYLIFAALIIVGASLYYSHRLTQSLADVERRNVVQLVEGLKTQSMSTDPLAIRFASSIVEENKSIPLILVDQHGEILDYKNIDTVRVRRDSQYLSKILAEMKAFSDPIEFDYGVGISYVYFGESTLLKQLRYYPYVQWATIFLFLVVVLIALTSAHRSLQNQVWVGLSKETAHQLGTPLSSLEGWVEWAREQGLDEATSTEMTKDLERLKLVADRFGKIGSIPKLVEEDLARRLRTMVQYMQKRAPQRVSIEYHGPESLWVPLSGPLFDWVMENLIRNSLDALEGKGWIRVQLQSREREVCVDVIDNGKGIPRPMMRKVFTPGFTTKTRGWGLGLSLSRRIIREFHHGSIALKYSEPEKGTQFRITLKR